MALVVFGSHLALDHHNGQMDASICSKCGTRSSTSATNSTIQSLKNAAAPGTRLHALIHSNEPPEPSEIPFIRSFAPEIDASLTSADAEILRLQEQLRSLQQDRSDLLDYQRTHKSILSPLRRMPPEILAEIFTSSIPVVSELLDRESFRIEDSPWVWTHICSRWRAVAISTPALWSVIAMDFANYDYPLEAAVAHVERSAMLKIHFYAFKKPWTDTSSQTQMFSYLIEHSLRWEELCIALTQDLIPLLPSLRNRIPSLGRLWVQVDGDLTEEVAPVVNFPQTAASLVEIGVSRCLSPGSFLPRTHQLTHYYADAPWDVHQEILRLSSSLVTAHVNLFPEPPDWSTLACEVVELPQLRCLFISHIEALAYFKTPLLGQITLDLFPDESDFPPAFERFLANSSSTLRRLGLRGMPDLILTSKILRACADLSELAIIIHPVTDALAYETSSALIRLLIPTQDSGILPRLSRIHVAFEGALSLDHELYAQMLESRWNMRPRVLQAATVCFQHEPNLSSIAHLRLGALRCGGLDFTLTKVGNAQEYMAHWLCRPGWIG